MYVHIHSVRQFLIINNLFFLFYSEMDGLGTTLAIGALKAIAFVCDILTFPIYVLLQRPWKACELSRRVKVILLFIVDLLFLS